MSEVLTPNELELAESKAKRVSKWVSHTRQHSPVNAFSPPTPPPTVIESKRIRAHTHSPHHRQPLVILGPAIMSNTVYSRHPIPSTDPRISGYHSTPMAYPSSPSYPHQPMPGPMIPASAPFHQQPTPSPIYPGNMFSHPSGMVPSGGYGRTGINPGMQPNHEFASLGRDETGSIIGEPAPPMTAPAGTGSGPHTFPGQMPNPNVIVMDDSLGSSSRRHHHHHPRRHRHRSPSRVRGRTHTRERLRTPSVSRSPSPLRTRSHSYSPRVHSTTTRDIGSSRYIDRDKDVPLADDEREIPPDYVPASPGPDSRSHESSSMPSRTRARPNGGTSANPTNASQNAPANPIANTHLGANPMVQAAEVAAANYVQGHGHGHKHKHGLKHKIEQAALDEVMGGVAGQTHAGAGNAAGSSAAPPLMQAAESALTGYAHGQGQPMQTQHQSGSHQRAPMPRTGGGHHHHHGHDRDRDHDRHHHHHHHGHGHGHGHGHHRSSSHPHSHSHHHDRHPTVHSRDFATFGAASHANAPVTAPPPVTTPSRPVFSRHRSRSIDDRDLQRSMARTRARYDDGGGGGYGGGTYGEYPTGSATTAHGYPAGASGTQGVYSAGGSGGVGNGGSHTQTIYPSSTQPTVVPVRDGKGGWVIVPPPGKNLHILDSHNRTLYHSGGHGAPTQVHPNKLRARSSSQPRAAAVPSQSFFSKFFGVGKRNGVSRERGRARMVQPQPVQYVHTR